MTKYFFDFTQYYNTNKIPDDELETALKKAITNTVALWKKRKNGKLVVDDWEAFLNNIYDKAFKNLNKYFDED